MAQDGVFNLLEKHVGHSKHSKDKANQVNMAMTLAMAMAIKTLAIKTLAIKTLAI